MGRFVNPENKAFRAAIKSEIYVDKSMLLDYTNKVLGTTQAFICNSRPRRFGKSITADMLTAYYSIGCNSSEIFDKLAISSTDNYEKNLNKYNVIHLDIQWCIEPAGKPENVISFITQNIISELRELYPAVLKPDITSLPDSLSRINFATGSQFIIIIDEWDVFIRDESSNESIQNDYINFLRGLFKGSEPTKYIALAYLTGILPIKKIKTQSALNNFDEFTMLDSNVLAPYIGFTDYEVEKLCNDYNIDFQKVKHWYDGYNLNNYEIYNPKAVVNVMLKGKFKSYWSETGTYNTILPLINMDFNGLRADIIKMISGDEVPVDVSSFQNDTINFKDKDDIITYLIHLGYLGYNEDKETAFVPNEELRLELIKATKRNKWNDFITFQQKSYELLEATLDFDENAVAEYIEEIHNDYAPSITYNNENSLSSILSIAYLSTLHYYFKPKREYPTGRGFADFIYFPKPEYINEYPALIVELKWNKNTKTAISQIKEKQYPASLKDYTGNILLIGINYDKKTKIHECRIESFNTIK